MSDTAKRQLKRKRSEASSIRGPSGPAKATDVKVGRTSKLPDHRALQGSMEQLLAGIGGGGRRRGSASDEAQEIMHEAWEATSRTKLIGLAMQALTISAECADAYALLAEEAES